MKDRLLLSILLGGLAMLVVELRFEHREALGETWHAWIPLAYAAATLLAEPILATTATGTVVVPAKL